MELVAPVSTPGRTAEGGLAALTTTDRSPFPAGPTGLAAIVGDDVAFRVWYDRNAPRVYAYLMSRCGSQSVAEELLQAVFMEVIRKPATFDGRADPVPWLIGIGRHQLARHYRKLEQSERWWSRERVRPIEPLSEGPEFRASEAALDIRRALASLPAMQQAALVFRFLDGLSVREVAAHLGRSEDATESLLRRARGQFERAYRGGTHAL
ncbi:MAG: RNA polymerase sigma factor [Chloroflexota bacterium]